MTLNTQNLKDWGCVMWLPLDGDANDYIGDYNGTRNGVTERRLQNGASCYNFDGNDTITTPYRTEGGDYSVSVWVYPIYETSLDGNVNCICGEIGGTSSTYGIYLRYWKKNFGIGHATSSSNFVIVQTDSIYDINQWYHVVAVRKNGIEFKIYINGEYAANGPCTSTTSIATHNLKIGDDYYTGYNRHLRGKMANFMMFKDHVLTDEQVKALYEATYIGD